MRLAMSDGLEYLCGTEARHATPKQLDAEWRFFCERDIKWRRGQLQLIPQPSRYQRSHTAADSCMRGPCRGRA